MEQDELARFHQTFFDEAREHVRTLEARLLELETTPEDLELLNALFRAAHSIKGSAGLLGFETLAKLTHALETLLDALRSQQLKVSPKLTSLLLTATDLLSACVESAAGKTADPDVADLVRELGLVAGAGHHDQPLPPVLEAAAPAGTSAWHIQFRPHAAVFAQGLDPALVLRDLVSLGAAHVTAMVDALPAFDELDPEQCHLGWRIDLSTTATEAQLREVFVFIEDVSDLTLTLEPPPTPSLPQVATVAEHEHAHAPAPSAPRPSAPGAQGAAADAATLRVATEKVDRLINLVGELVISQAMINRSLQHFTPEELPRLQEAVAEMERHTREMQDRVLNIRMVPIGSIFGRFRRLVRDLSESLDKQLTLELIGETTELDKSMVEHLADPLTHLVRNAADHGLEPAAERRAAGKSEQGHVTLSARHQGGNVVVDVSDDGRGLDVERIKAKAIERGLISADQFLNEDEISQLIFEPGFSTKEQVTDLSGRGVGMDVVRRSVTALNGTITIASAKGQGTRFRITLPLTLAILDGMALRVGQATFVLPLNQVLETLSIKAESVKALLGSGEIMFVRGETLPLLRLSRLLGVPDDGAENRRPLAVVLESGDARFGLVVDELLGQGQFVIKSLEPNFEKLQGMLGATILGDGAVALILDVPGLARLGNVRLRDDREGTSFSNRQLPEAHA
jgi:two-component system chemotaxis sensor kinase CheA